MPSIATDGSSVNDAKQPVEIDTGNPAIKWKWSCPNGHTSIDPTNGGVWCKSCANAVDIDDPHHTEILNKRTGETVPWSSVDWR